MFSKKIHTQGIIFFLIIFVTLFSCKDKNTNTDEGDTRKNGIKTEDKKPLGLAVKGKVKLADKTMHEGIVVYIAGTTLAARTTKEGDFAFPPLKEGKYEIYAEKSGYQPESFNTIEIDNEALNAGNAVILETLTLQPVVKEDTSVSLANFTGHATLENESNYSGIIVKIKGTDIKTVTDNLGEYNFRNLTPGIYAFVFSHNNFKSVEYSQEIAPGDNAQLQESIVLKRDELSESTKRIRGSVDIFDLAGNQLNNFSDVIVSLEGTSYLSMPNSTGRFVINDIPPGKYTVNASAKGFINRNKIDVDLEQNEEVTISIYMDQIAAETGTGTISGNVKLNKEDADNSNISIALAGTSFVAVPDNAGSFKLTGIPEGVYTFVARAEGFTSVKAENIEVKKDANTDVGAFVLEIKVIPPEILSTSPYNEQNDIVVKAEVPVSVRFSKKMKPESVKKAFSISPQVESKAYIGREHPQSDYDLLYVEISGINERNPLKFKTNYKVTINQDAEDFEGGKLENDYEFTFKTIAASIIRTDPVDGERNAFLNEGTPIVIYFNTKLKYETFNEKSVRIEPAPRSTIRTHFSEDQKTGWTIAYIYSNWDHEKNYTLTIGRGVRTENNQMIDNIPFKLKFRTTKMVEAETGFKSK